MQPKNKADKMLGIKPNPENTSGNIHQVAHAEEFRHPDVIVEIQLHAVERDYRYANAPDQNGKADANEQAYEGVALPPLVMQLAPCRCHDLEASILDDCSLIYTGAKAHGSVAIGWLSRGENDIAWGGFTLGLSLSDFAKIFLRDDLTQINGNEEDGDGGQISQRIA